jgi:hypothetical protein
MILGTGEVDEEILSAEASVGVRAFWCEHYDAFGRARRLGPYREVYPNGQIRLEATYVKAGETVRLEGPVEIRNEDGSPFLRGFLKGGEWAGEFVIFHESGQPWFEGHFEQGRLDGSLRTHHADGALESETKFSDGREQGLARSFYGTAAGGRLKSEVRMHSDQIVGAHRLLDRKGGLRREIDWNADAGDWQSVGVPRTAAPSKAPAVSPEPQGLDAIWPIAPTAPTPTGETPASASGFSSGSARKELNASN